MDACIALIGKHNLSMMFSPRDLVELHADLTELSKYRQKIAHIHVENPEVPETSSPPRASDRYDYLAFFKALGIIDYAGVISLPAGSRKDTLAYCRQLWASAEADV
jgi:hydroxypyruvate isomerase